MTTTILGIDVSKDKLDCCLLLNDRSQSRTIDNNSKGFEKLSAWLKEHNLEQLHACMESTGIYGRAAAAFLYERGYKVSIINPRLICNYSKAKGLRNKTDKIDAALIAEYCQVYKPGAWTPLDKTNDAFQQICRLTEERKLQLVTEKNRLKDAISAVAQKAIKKLIKSLEKQILELQKEMLKLINSNASIKNNYNLLLSIPGIGEVTAAILLAELADINRFRSVRQAAAYAGVTPQIRESGSSVRGKSKLSKIGNKRLRRALYMPAVARLRSSAAISQKAQRLAAKGKHKMCIVGAIMHQLLRTAYGVLKNQKPFDPNWKSKPPMANNTAAVAAG